MINHARTLLLNNAAADFTGVTGSEFIESTFRPVVLDPDLQRVQDILFPPGLDAFTRNEVVFQLLQLLRHPDLVSYGLTFDPRITYDLDANTLTHITDHTVSITTSKNATCDMTPKYVLDPTNFVPTQGDAGEHTWIFTTGNAESVRFKKPGGVPELHDIVRLGAATTAALTLVPNYLTAYFDTPTGQLTGSYRFEYVFRISLPYDLSDVHNRLQAHMSRPGVTNRLFEDWTLHAVELNALYQVWRDSPEAPMRIAAACLSFVYELERLRQARGEV